MKIKRFLAKSVMVLTAPGYAVNYLIAAGHRPVPFFILAGTWCVVMAGCFYAEGFLSSIFGRLGFFLAAGTGVVIFRAFCGMVENVAAVLTDLPATWYMKCRDYRQRTDEAARAAAQKDLQYFIDMDRKKKKYLV